MLLLRIYIYIYLRLKSTYAFIIIWITHHWLIWLIWNTNTCEYYNWNLRLFYYWVLSPWSDWTPLFVHRGELLGEVFDHLFADVGVWLAGLIHSVIVLLTLWDCEVLGSRLAVRRVPLRYIPIVLWIIVLVLLHLEDCLHVCNQVAWVVAWGSLVQIGPNVHLVPIAYHLVAHSCAWHNLSVVVQLSWWDSLVLMGGEDSVSMVHRFPIGWSGPIVLVLTNNLIGSIVLVQTATADVRSLCWVTANVGRQASAVLAVVLFKEWDLVVHWGVDRAWWADVALGGLYGSWVVGWADLSEIPVVLVWAHLATLVQVIYERFLIAHERLQSVVWTDLWEFLG